MASRQHPSGLPSSPWAEIFYPSGDPFWSTRGDGLAHSGLAPEYPALAREDLGDGRLPPREEPKPSPADLDRLFYSERQQKDELGGIMTWQIGALREGFYTLDEASQHDRACLDSLTIDESTWMPCFRKDRWFENPSSISRHLRNPINGLLAAHSTDRLTVDNPFVWNEVRFCIEIANRILGQLVLSRDPLLDAVLFGERMDWAAMDSAVMAAFYGKPGYPPKVVFQRPPDLVASSQEMVTKIVQLSQDVVWGFMDDENQHQNGCILGLSVRLYAAQVFQTVPPNFSNHGGREHLNGALLHNAMFRPLWEADTPLVERCAARLHVAIIMVHELTDVDNIATQHCLGRAMTESEQWEPFISPYGDRELGRIAEIAAFGQGVSFTPILYRSGAVGSGANMVGVALKFPPRHQVIKLPPKFQPPWDADDECVYLIPTEWTTAMQSQPYWLDVVSRWGTRALNPPHIFRSNVENPVYYIGDRRHGAFPIQLDDVPQEMESLYLNTVQRWRRQYVTQRSNRPWWEAESRKWYRSPWSWTHARQAIYLFREAHRKRNMARCLQQIKTLWFHNGGDQAVWNHPTTWLYRCICHLMMASIPMPQGPFYRWGRPLRLAVIPSQQAAQRFNYQGEMLPSAEHQSNEENLIVDNWPFISITSNCLSDFYGLFAATARQSPQPWVWLEACMTAFRDLCRDSVRDPGLDVWLPFNFNVPSYEGNTPWAYVQDEGQGFAYEGQCFPNITYGFMPAPLSDVDRLVSPPSTPPPPDQLPHPSAPLPAYSTMEGGWGGAPVSQPVSTRYFSVGTVGNHMCGDSFWVVEPDSAQGYDIFRITKKCKELGYHTADHIRRELVTVGPLGPSLLTDSHPHAEEIRREFGHSLHPIGKLLVRKKLEVIAEHNGQHDMPLWIIIGSDVYDITKFPFGSREEEDQLRSNPGSVPKTLPVSDDDQAKLLERLLPFKCALVDGTRGSKKPVLEPYTPSMLRWHDNPTAGMYTAINGIVYDVTGYYESHPGGTDILIGDLGKESTGFFKHHDAEMMNDYEDLALGRLVPEMPAGQLGKHQVAIQGWVYDLSGLNRDEHWFLEAIQPLGGQDASAALAGSNATASALLHLVEYEKGRVVGGVASADAIGEIPEGELARHCDPRRVHGGWVAVAGWVYDLTAVMVHGAPFYGRAVPWFWAGRDVTDPDLRDWVHDALPHRVVGRLVPGEAWPAGSGEAEGDVVGEKRKRSRSQEGFGEERGPRCKLYA